jgi:hypothetical protein
VVLASERGEKDEKVTGLCILPQRARRHRVVFGGCIAQSHEATKEREEEEEVLKC